VIESVPITREVGEQIGRTGEGGVEIESVRKRLTLSRLRDLDVSLKPRSFISVRSLVDASGIDVSLQEALLLPFEGLDLSADFGRLTAVTVDATLPRIANDVTQQEHNCTTR